MPTIGADCDVMLAHPEVDAGQPYGFLVEPKSERYGPVVQVHWEKYTNPDGSLNDVRHLWFTVMLADNLMNPDGSYHQATAAEMYAKLIELLTQPDQIALVTRMGAIAGLASTGHVMEQQIYPEVILVVCQLTTKTSVFQPVNYDYYMRSVWVDEDTDAGEMNWGNSYWRS